MAKHDYERLSAQDFSLLVFEKPNVHMHVTSTQVFEAGPLRKPDGGINIEMFRRAIDGVLHLIPRYRQRLMWTPIENRPVWVDDSHFHLNYHIRHTALPRPGGDTELKQLVARVKEQQLDRARPLWEMWVVEGLQGDRFATVSKVHHCMLDGISGVDLAHVLFSPKPDYEIQEAPRYVPHQAPSQLELLSDAVMHRLSLPFQLARGVTHFRRHAADQMHDLRIRAQAIRELLGYVIEPGSQTPINGAIGMHRRVDWMTTPLAHLEAIGHAMDCTVNDVVLASVAGAVREYLISRRVHPGEIDFRVSAPVNVRGKEDRGKLGNRVSSWIIPLPIAEANARKRLEALHKFTSELKASKQALGVETMMAIAEWAPASWMAVGARVINGPINMIVTNVPGPRKPLYLLGARLLQLYPLVPLLENTGLGIALITYAGQICWGFNADYEMVPDLPNFVRMLATSINELAAAAGVELEHRPIEIAAAKPAPRPVATGRRQGKLRRERALPAKPSAVPVEQATAS